MANTVTKQKVIDGDRNAVIHVWIAGEAAGSDETDTVIVDVSDLSGSPSEVSLQKVHASLSGFTALLEWDATTDVPFFQLPDGSEVNADFCGFGGLQNNAGTGVTGDITITTTGLDAATDHGHITLWVRKS